MGMCRIVLADGRVMHLAADIVDIEDGHLCLRKGANDDWVGSFAPSVWAYWLWVTMSAPSPTSEP